MADTGKTVPRGIRNHNPLNIREARDGGIDWDGERATDDDPAFEEFDSPEMGIRAAVKILLTYQRKYGLWTVRDIINRWAPGHENPTDTYVMWVAKGMAVDPDEVVDLATERTRLKAMISAMIRFENGEQPYLAPTIDEGIARALA